MQIFVKGVEGKPVNIKVTDDKTKIKILKSLVEAKEEISIEEQKIYFGGKMLIDNDATFGDYYDNEGSSQQFVVRLVGGI
ncbi:predicted protein [Arabidopsis lyrata subsp. lyrata]|uniref:Predicted protein n=1 Tax=Arabidopsis lyrata subsp. lyrata TaxID=81972 RepID=D7KSD2_ARALL|nr:predicted protein [Arabidopsis lyrata subsp. lyrata]